MWEIGNIWIFRIERRKSKQKGNKIKIKARMWPRNTLSFISEYNNVVLSVIMNTKVRQWFKMIYQNPHKQTKKSNMKSVMLPSFCTIQVLAFSMYMYMYLFQAICLLCVYLYQAGKFYFLSDCTSTASGKVWTTQALLLANFIPEKYRFWQILYRISAASGKFWTGQVLLLVNFETDKHCRLQIVDPDVIFLANFELDTSRKHAYIILTPLNPTFM